MDGPWEDDEFHETRVLQDAKEADVGSYLQATVSYTDVEFDEADTVSGVTRVWCGRGPLRTPLRSIPAQSIEVFENTDGTIGSVTAKDDEGVDLR